MQLPKKYLQGVSFLLVLVCFSFLLFSRMVFAQQERSARSRGKGMDGEMLASVPTAGSETGTPLSGVTTKPAVSSSVQEFPAGRVLRDFFRNLSKKPEQGIFRGGSIQEEQRGRTKIPAIQPVLTPEDVVTRLESRVQAMKEQMQRQIVSLEKAKGQLDSFQEDCSRRRREIQQLEGGVKKTALLLEWHRKRESGLEGATAEAGGLRHASEQLRKEKESLGEIGKSLTAAYERGIQLTLEIGTGRNRIGSVMQELGKLQAQLREQEQEIQKGVSVEAVSSAAAQPDARSIRLVQRSYQNLQKEFKGAQKKQSSVQEKLAEVESDRSALESHLGELIRRIRNQSDFLKQAQAGITRMQSMLSQEIPETGLSQKKPSAEMIDGLLQKEVMQLKQQVQAQKEEMERLRSSRSQGGEKLERQLSELKAEMEQTRADAQEQFQKMQTAQASAQQEKARLKQLLDSKEDDLARLQSELEDTRTESIQWKADNQGIQQELATLQEQLKMSRKIQQEQSTQLQALPLEARHLTQRNADLTTALAQVPMIQEQIRQLQTERLSIENQVSDLRTVMERAGRTYQDRKRDLSLQGGEDLLDTQRLQRELEAAKTEQIHAAQKRETIQQELKKVGEQTNKLTADLQSLEQIAKQSQSPPPKPQDSPIPDTGNQLPREFLSSKVLQVTVQRIGEHQDFFVLSLEGASGIKEGSVLQLSKEDQPIAEVEVGIIDQAGYAVAYVTHPLENLSDIREGTLLFARHIVKMPSPVSEER